jgi:hypothetical protein
MTIKLFEEFDLDEAKNPKPQKIENYIVFKGEEIVGNTTSIDKAWELYNSLPAKTRILDGRAIYQAIYEE